MDENVQQDGSTQEAQPTRKEESVTSYRTSMMDAATKEINKVCDQLEKVLNRPSVLTYSQLMKYRILFDNEMKEKVIKGTATDDELRLITELSKEFYGSINQQAITYIVEDSDPSKVIVRMPPLQMRMNTLVGEGATIMDALQGAFTNTDASAGGPGEIKRMEVTSALTTLFLAGTSTEEVVASAKLYQEIADEFNLYMSGKAKPIWQQALEAEQPTTTTNTEGSSSDNEEVDPSASLF